MYRSFLLILIVFTLVSCGSSDPYLHFMDRMCGDWEFTGTEIKEHWENIGQGAYQVDVVSHAGWEPEQVQRIDIQREGDKVIYTGTILREHNTTRPIRFEATEISDTHILFQNVAQEFPQHIRYTLIHADKFRVSISGSQDGRTREQEFVYYRIASEHAGSD
ncbi:MAG: hypothetical protein HKN79_02285 [Flavobacteriales bacterium]|nr:hypothetical protein [Flavobacteriales bacterium]